LHKPLTLADNADARPTEPSPSTSFDAVADALHAPDAHAVSEYHEPPADRTDLDTMLRDVSPPTEVAL
jgi:hypothetical protein